MSIAFMAVTTSSMAQSLNKMNWLNEPQQWEIKDGKTLVMDVPAKTDFWRISHYGFTVDDGPFYYATYGGEFEAKVKITGNYVTTFDQMGLMLRIDHENWIKAGVEYVDGKQNVAVNPFPSGQAPINPTMTGQLSCNQHVRIIIYSLSSREKNISTASRRRTAFIHIERGASGNCTTLQSLVRCVTTALTFCLPSSSVQATRNFTTRYGSTRRSSPPSHIPGASQQPARGFRKPRERPEGTPAGRRRASRPARTRA